MVKKTASCTPRPARRRLRPPILSALPSLEAKGKATRKLNYIDVFDGEQRDWVWYRETLEFRLALEAAWKRLLDPAKIARLASDRDQKSCRSCGGVEVVRRWVVDYWDASDHHLPRYGVPAGQVIVRCPNCRASKTGPLPPPPSGDRCPACQGDGILPEWATREIETGGTGEWTGAAMSNTIYWYPAPCTYCGGWGRLPSATQEAQLEPSPQSPPKNYFNRSGDNWKLCYQGHELGDMAKLLGLQYLAAILGSPGKTSFSYQELFVDVHGHRLRSPREEPKSSSAPNEKTKHSRVVDGEDVDAKLSQHSRQEYGTALTKARNLLQTEPDREARDKLADKIKWLETELNTASGLGGRGRRFPNDKSKCRTKVSNAIALAIARIKKRDPKLAEHLQVHIKVPNGYRYHGGLNWEVSLK